MFQFWDNGCSAIARFVIVLVRYGTVMFALVKFAPVLVIVNVYVAESATAELVDVIDVVKSEAAVAILANTLNKEIATKAINARREIFLYVFMLHCLRVCFSRLLLCYAYKFLVNNRFHLFRSKRSNKKSLFRNKWKSA